MREWILLSSPLRGNWLKGYLTHSFHMSVSANAL
jgi:hypothetical protein